MCGITGICEYKRQIEVQPELIHKMNGQSFIVGPMTKAFIPLPGLVLVSAVSALSIYKEGISRFRTRMGPYGSC